MYKRRRNVKRGMAVLLSVSLLCTTDGAGILAASMSETQAVESVSGTESSMLEKASASAEAATKVVQPEAGEKSESDRKLADTESGKVGALAESTEQTEGVEEPAKAEDTEHAEEPAKPEDTEHVEEPAKPEDTEHVEEPAKPEDTEHVEEPAKPEDTEHVEEPAKPEDTEHVEEPETSTETQEPENSEKPADTQKPETDITPEESEKLADTELEENTEEAANTEQPENVEESENSEQLADTEEVLEENTGELKTDELVSEEGLKYTKSGTTVEITGYDGDASSLMIPDKLEGYTVTMIRSSAFKGCSSLVNITLPSKLVTLGSDVFEGTSVKSIKVPKTVTSCGYAFAGAEELKEVEFEAGMTKIPSNALSNRNNACHVEKVIIPSTVKEIGSGAFYKCESLKGDVGEIIPASVKTIGNSAFYACIGLESANFKEGLETIGNSAFAECNSLETVTLPSKLETLEYAVFAGTPLKRITIPKTVTSCSEAFLKAAELTEVEFEAGMTKIPEYVLSCTNSSYKSNVEKVVIPSTVTEIGKNAFYGCENLKGDIGEIIPASVETIGESAFQNCSGIEKAGFRNGIQTIDYNAFSGCTSLTSIGFPKSLKMLYSDAFSGCKNLEQVTFEENSLTGYSTKISNGVFLNNTSLTEVSFSKNIREIGSYVFDGCNSLEKVTLPSKLESLGNRAFRGTAIQKIKIPKTLEYAVLIQHDGPFGGAKKLKAVEFESGMTNIPSYILSGASDVEKVVIPSTVKEIGSEAFYGCEGLKGDIGEIIPKSVERISNSAFRGCTNIESANLKAGIKTIEENAFSGCSCLEYLTLPSTVETLGYDIFDGTVIRSITIPKTLTRCYGNDYYYQHAGPFDGAEQLKEVVFESGMTTIPNGVLEAADSVKWVVIPASVKEIASSAFSGCDKMTICGKAGSYAETYAEEKKIPFEIVRVDKDTTEEEILSLIDVKNLVGDIEISGSKGKIEGPTLKVGKSEITLFEFEPEVKNEPHDMVQVRYDKEKQTIQVLIGVIDIPYDKDASDEKGRKTDANKKDAWEKVYANVKSLCDGAKGNLSPDKLKSKFSSMKNDLVNKKSPMGFEADTTFAGYIELGVAPSGELFKLGGGLTAEIEFEIEKTFPVPTNSLIYVTFGLEGDGKNDLEWEMNNATATQPIKAMPNMELSVDLTANAGVGGGGKAVETYAEVGIEGNLPTTLKYPKSTLEEALEVNLNLAVYSEVKILGIQLLASKTDPYEIQLYPRNEKIRLLDGRDLTAFDRSAVTLVPRPYLQERGIVAQNLVSEGVTLEKDNLYRQCAPQLAEFSDNTKLLVWVDDDGSKTGVNKTSLKYAVYDGTAWGKEMTLDAKGGVNDYPTIYSDGVKAYLVWQAAPEAAENTTLEELLVKVDLYGAVWENGVMGEPEQLTDNNTAYEMQQTVTVHDGRIAVAWVENSENDPFQTEGTSSVKVKEYANGTWTEKKIAEQLAGVSDIENFYQGNKLVTAYETAGENTSIVVSTDAETKTFSGYGMVAAGNRLYYNTEAGLMEYDIASSMTDSVGVGGLQGYEVLENGTEKMILTTVSDGFKSELSAYKFDSLTGEWSAPVILSDEGKYIRSFSAVLDGNNKLVIACNQVDVDENADSVYGKAKLSVTDYAEQRDLSVGKEVWYELEALTPGAELPLHFFVTNNGLEEVNSFNVTLQNEAGDELQSGEINCRIAPGETVEASYNYSVPEHISQETLTIRVQEDGETKLDNNTTTVVLGVADITLENLHLEGSATEAELAGTVRNAGFAPADEVTLSVYDKDMDGTLAGSVSLGAIAVGDSSEFSVAIPEELLEVHPLASGNYLYVNAETNAEELRFDNNSELFLIKAEREEPLAVNCDTLELKPGESSELLVTYGNAGEKPVTWESSDETVATVENGVVTALQEGTAEITATVGWKTAVCRVTVTDDVSVTDVYLNETAINVQSGDTKQLTAQVLPLDAKNQNVTWETSDASVASVSSNGLVTAAGVGKAVITAASEDGYKTASCTVTVSQKAGTIYLVNFNGGEGASGTDPASQEGVAGTIITLPENTYTNDGKTFVGWSDGTKVYEAGAGYKIPYRNITLTAEWKETELQEFTITASAGAGGTIAPEGTISVQEGDTQKFVITPSEGYVIADVMVDGVSVGTNNTYTFENVAANHKIECTFHKKPEAEKPSESDKETESDKNSETANPVKITGITLNKAVTLQKGKKVTLKAKVNPASATNKKLTWKSSNLKVAEVNSAGRVSAKAGGTTTITATATDGSGKKASCKVTVPYTITYKLNKGKNHSKNPKQYYNQKITLKNPTRRGYAFKGWYTDSKYKKKITTIAKSAKKDYVLYAKWEKISIKKTTITSVKNTKKGQVSLKYKKIAGVKGYEVWYSTDKTFKKSVGKKTTTKTSYIMKKMKKGKTYYVKVHGYQLDSTGKKVYGGWTKVKKITIDK